MSLPFAASSVSLALARKKNMIFRELIQKGRQKKIFSYVNLNILYEILHCSEIWLSVFAFYVNFFFLSLLFFSFLLSLSLSLSLSLFPKWHLSFPVRSSLASPSLKTLEICKKALTINIFSLRLAVDTSGSRLASSSSSVRMPSPLRTPTGLSGIQQQGSSYDVNKELNRWQKELLKERLDAYSQDIAG